MDQNGDVYTDLTACPHILEVDQDRLLQTQEQFEESAELQCVLCQSKTENLFICLNADCLNVLCTDGGSDHSLGHYQKEGHCVYLNLTTLRVWCHECELEIIVTDEDSTFESKKQRPRGLTGLQNLGNTCYMNSALQALANAPPLVKYILSRNFAEVEQCQGRSRLLVTSFHNLINEMWSVKRHLYISPPHILYAIRATHPMFRGFQQHDSQEFLRCLMDQLHEEMKIPCPEPLPVQCSYDDSDMDGSSEGEEYETCDSGVSERSSLSEDIPKASRPPSPDEFRHKAQPKKKIHYRSIISDIFDGNLLSSVQCLTCNRVSTRVETFQDLSLPIPSRDHLNILHQGNVPGPPKCTHLYSREQGWYTWIWDWLCSWFWGPTVSLHDCLSAFFSADELKGDNMYSCDKCNKLRNGVKFSKVLKTPEILCIHLKRFRHDLVFSSKISSYIKFPMEGLDIRPYIHEDWQGGVTKYNLISVICHHGASGSGGHYTCYALNSDSNQWYHYDDSNVTKVSRQMVNTSQAYVLFYMKDSSKAQRWRSRFHHIERSTTSEPKTHLVSTHWMMKFLTFSEPGPIDNRDLVEPYNEDTRSCVRVSSAVWHYLSTTFKGGPNVQMDSLRCLGRGAASCPEPSYAVSLSWISHWESFLRGATSDPPGPIDNSQLVPGQICEVTGAVWDSLVAEYGGGPPVLLSSRDPEPKIVLENGDAGIRPEHSPDDAAPQPNIPL